MIVRRLFLCLTIISSISVVATFAQSTAFSYQGSIKQNGVAANGNFDLQFSVFDDPSGGIQQGTTVTLATVQVTNGVFTVSLDFGAAIFTGPPRFLQIAVRPAGSPNPHTALTPRTQVISVPYAMKSLAADTAGVAATAGNALQLGGIPASQYLQTASAPITGDIQFTGNVLLAPSNRSKAGPTPTPPAILYAINPQPGITNPSLANLPPAAVRGDATSTVNANVGVLGLANGANGAGVLAIQTGAEGAGMTAIHTATTGEGQGIVATTLSPEGTVLDLNMPSGGNGNLIYASSGSEPNTIGRFSVKSNGETDVNGSLRLTGNQMITGNLSVTGNVGLTGSLGAFNATNMFANNVQLSGNLAANSLSITGTKNNVVKLSEGRTVLFYANESPEYWFEDFGTVTLIRGRAIVKIDPTFAEATNTAINYKVFLTPNGRTSGLYVVRKNATTFEVRENGRGKSNISFDYRIVAKRRGYENLRFGPSNK